MLLFAVFHRYDLVNFEYLKELWIVLSCVILYKVLEISEVYLLNAV